MSLLTICNRLAANVGIETTTQVMTSSDRNWLEAVAMSNAVGEEIARRVDFGALFGTATLTGTGADQTFDLGGGFSRIIQGIGVNHGTAAVRPLTRAEWAALTPVEGVPRYFLLEGAKLRLWPFMALGDTVTARYQSKNWCSNGTAAWGADTDTSLISEDLMTKGLIAYWRRQKGMPYSDYAAEFESDLADFAKFDDRSRV